jgi:hypothetical protein
LVCMVLRISTRFAIQKSVQKKKTRYMYCGSHPAWQTVVAGYIRRGQTGGGPLWSSLHWQGALRAVLPALCAPSGATAGRSVGARGVLRRGQIALYGPSLVPAQGLGCLLADVRSCLRVHRLFLAWSCACYGSILARSPPGTAAGDVNSRQHAAKGGRSTPCCLTGPVPALRREPKSRCACASGITGCSWTSGYATVPSARRGRALAGNCPVGHDWLRVPSTWGE